MKSGQHLKLPKSELGQMEDDLRRQARMERLKIDIKVKDNGDDTVDIAWTVSDAAVPATSTAPAGGRGEGVTAAAPPTESNKPKTISTAPTGGSSLRRAPPPHRHQPAPPHSGQLLPAQPLRQHPRHRPVALSLRRALPPHRHQPAPPHSGQLLPAQPLRQHPPHRPVAPSLRAAQPARLSTVGFRKHLRPVIAGRQASRAAQCQEKAVVKFLIKQSRS